MTGFGFIPAAQAGGAISIEDDPSATATLRRVRLADNGAVVGGALIIGSNGDGDPVRLRIYDSIIEDNFIDGSALGAISGCLGGGLSINAPTIIERTSILRNTADNANGGGLCINDAEVTLLEVTVANNEVGVNGLGAGIYADEAQLTISESTIDDNDIVGGSGGAIYARGGVLTVSDSAISNNTAAGISLIESDFTARNIVVDGHSAPLGDGLRASDSVVRLTDCTFSNNQATLEQGLSGIGGAIYLIDSALDMRGCTLHDNQAVSGGGAMVLSNGSFSIILNSTFSNNQAESAEAILVNNAQIPVSLRHVTLAASNGNSLIDLINSSASFRNSAIAGSCELFLGGGTPSSEGGNVVGDINCFLNGPGDLITNDFGLAALGDFGGPTLSHLPAVNSPLVDISFDNCPPSDQRGESRDPPCDAGAIELKPSDDLLFADGFEAASNN